MIKFELTSKAGYKGYNTGPCFGSLNSNRSGQESNRVSNKATVSSGRWVDPRQNRMRDLSFISYEPLTGMSSLWWMSDTEKNENFFSEALELAKDLKNHQDILRVNPFTKRIDVFVEGVSREKVMATLFMFRNLASYSDILRTYKHIRSLGYNRLFSCVMSQLVCKNSGAFSGNNTSASMWNMGEQTLFNPHTFGVQSFLSFLRQDGFDFFGTLWTVKPGYSREEDYRIDNVTFSGNYGRRLPDVLSIINDDPLPFQVKNPSERTCANSTEGRVTPFLGRDEGGRYTWGGGWYGYYFFPCNPEGKTVYQWCEILADLALSHNINVRE